MHIGVGKNRERAEKTAIKPKKKGVGKRGWIIAGAVVAAVAVIMVLAPKKSVGNYISTDDITKIYRGDFSNSISATGAVESENSYYIYSTQNYLITDVFVEVGDKVTPDTVLCKLDDDALTEQLELRQAGYSMSAASGAQSVKTAQDNYDSMKDSLDNGTNQSIISAESSVRNAKDAYDNAKKNYDEYVQNSRDGLNTALIAQDNAVENAANAVESAKSALEDAEDAYSDAKKALRDFDSDTSDLDEAVSQAKDAYSEAKNAASQAKRELESAQAAVTAAESAYAASGTDEDYTALENARAALGEAQSAYNEAQSAQTSAKSAYDRAKSQRDSAVSSSRDQLESARDRAERAVESAERALSNAEDNYDAAVKNREAAYRSADSTLADLATSVDSAYAAYQTAQQNLEATKNGTEDQLQQSYNSLQSAKIGANTKATQLEIENLKKDIDDTTITAGVEGTVTAVYAEVGYMGSGLLFVIEDTDDLVISTSVKEYDVGDVDVGMPVTIKSEGTGDDVYDGEITSVAPAAMKNAQGMTNTSGDIEFAVKVGVTSAETKLKIGMNVRLKYIIEQESDVMYVSYDSLGSDSRGSYIIYLEAQSDGSFIPRQLYVERGMENDTDVVISGEGVEEGLSVVSNPDGYLHLVGQKTALISSMQMAMQSMS